MVHVNMDREWTLMKGPINYLNLERDFRKQIFLLGEFPILNEIESNSRQIITLPKDSFSLAKSSAGNLIIKEGKDSSDGCFLFLQEESGYGDIYSVQEEATTAKILLHVNFKHSNNGGGYQRGHIVALLQKGEEICFINHSNVKVYTWDGASINSEVLPHKKYFTKERVEKMFERRSLLTSDSCDF